MTDKLEDMFFKQKCFMNELVADDKLPEFPVPLQTKFGQRLAKETVFNVIEELCEASFTLRNKIHRSTDDTALDIDHYKEEIGDAFAYFVELCILSGIDAEQLYEEYCKKNKIVFERLKSGY